MSQTREPKQQYMVAFFAGTGLDYAPDAKGYISQEKLKVTDHPRPRDNNRLDIDHNDYSFETLGKSVSAPVHGFDGCDRRGGGAYAYGIKEPVDYLIKELESKIISAESPKIMLALTAHSRGCLSALLLAKKLSQHPLLKDKVDLVLDLRDPVPGNIHSSASMDVAGVTTIASQLKDLRQCTNIKEAHITVLEKGLMPVVFDVLLPKFSKATKVEVDYLPGTHDIQDAKPDDALSYNDPRFKKVFFRLPTLIHLGLYKSLQIYSENGIGVEYEDTKKTVEQSHQAALGMLDKQFQKLDSYVEYFNPQAQLYVIDPKTTPQGVEEFAKQLLTDNTLENGGTNPKVRLGAYIRCGEKLYYWGKRDYIQPNGYVLFQQNQRYVKRFDSKLKVGKLKIGERKDLTGVELDQVEKIMGVTKSHGNTNEHGLDMAAMKANDAHWQLQRAFLQEEMAVQKELAKRWKGFDTQNADPRKFQAFIKENQVMLYDHLLKIYKDHPELKLKKRNLHFGDSYQALSDAKTATHWSKRHIEIKKPTALILKPVAMAGFRGDRLDLAKKIDDDIKYFIYAALDKDIEELFNSEPLVKVNAEINKAIDERLVNKPEEAAEVRRQIVIYQVRHAYDIHRGQVELKKIPPAKEGMERLHQVKLSTASNEICKTFIENILKMIEAIPSWKLGLGSKLGFAGQKVTLSDGTERRLPENLARIYIEGRVALVDKKFREHFNQMAFTGLIASRAKSLNFLGLNPRDERAEEIYQAFAKAFANAKETANQIALGKK